MKKILVLIASLLIAGTAYADSCAVSLMPAFTANQATQLCNVLGTSITTALIKSDSSLVIQVDDDAQRKFTFDAASDTALSLTFGDGGTTAAQKLDITSSTADADDDSLLCLTGAGVCGSAARGSFGASYGNEHATLAGQFNIQSGNASGADVKINTNDDFFLNTLAEGNLLIVTELGKVILNGELGNQATSYGCTLGTGANTACTTTCTTGCLFGWDAGTTAPVACDSALADSCICCN